MRWRGNSSKFGEAGEFLRCLQVLWGFSTVCPHKRWSLPSRGWCRSRRCARRAAVPRRARRLHRGAVGCVSAVPPLPHGSCAAGRGCPRPALTAAFTGVLLGRVVGDAGGFAQPGPTASPGIAAELPGGSRLLHFFPLGFG